MKKYAVVAWIVLILSCGLCDGIGFEKSGELPILYPFPKAEKFGFIDRNGQWVIPPRFDLCNEVFVGDSVLVQSEGRKGFIDRKGEWVKPQPGDPPWGPGWEKPGSEPPGAPFGRLEQSASGFLIGFVSQKSSARVGLWKRSGEPVLPPEYLSIFITEDRAWVLDANMLLGVYALEGNWILKPSIPWNGNIIPEPLQEGVAWYRNGSKWGLLSRDGVVVSPPQFRFNTPFKSGRAWVSRDKLPESKAGNGENPPARGGKSLEQETLLISTEGKELISLGGGSADVRVWGESLWLVSFEDRYIESKRKWLLDRDGKKILEADRISDLSDGPALVEVREKSGLCSYGYINARGEVVIPFGTWGSALPFSEGLAGVLEKERGRGVWQGVLRKDNGLCDTEHGWGFIDTQGRMVIPPKYEAVNGFQHMGNGLQKLFVDGIAAVSQDYNPTYRFSGIGPRMYWGLIDREGHELTPRVYDGILGISEGLLPCCKGNLWGYLDKTGREAIPLQFGRALPFYRGRAWVLKAGAEPGKPFWAVIDQHGKLLTDYTWRSPSNDVVWEPERLEELRWCGDFLRMPVEYGGEGLATADGKIVMKPWFFEHFRDLREGEALGMNMSWDRKRYEITLINKSGPVATTNRYTDITQFVDGSAWATQRCSDYTKPAGWVCHDEGWWLIDSNGSELTSVRYAKPDWVWATASIPLEPKLKPSFYSDQAPRFFGDLAPVVPVEGMTGGAGRSFRNAWGYVNRAGKIVAWYEPPTKR